MEKIFQTKFFIIITFVKYKKIFIINKMSTTLVNSKTFDELYTKESSLELKNKYPNKIPVIIFTVNEIDIQKRKYLVDKGISCGQLLAIFRSKINKISQADGLYMFIGDNSSLAPASKTLVEIFDEYNTNGFLKVHLAKESTFG